jgi:PTS system mannose-specific IIA component
MVGVVVATHGKLAEELVRTAEGIVGKLDRCRAMTIAPSAPIEELNSAIRKAAAEVDGGDGVIVLVDMFGGTAANLALGMCGGPGVEVISGVNLPMLLKLATCRADKQPLSALASMLVAYGQKNITHCSEALRARMGG